MRPVRTTIATLVLSLTAFAAEAQREIPSWTLGSSPLVAIGGDGTPPTEFTRIAAAVRLSNGMIAVVNGATSEIRIFDERGRYLRAFGRSGAGPGEFKSISWIGRSADTAFFYDFNQKRITSVLLGAEPRLVRTVPLTAVADRGRVDLVGRLRDGRWLVQTATSPGWDGPPGVYRMPSSVGLMNADASGAIDWMGKFDGMAVFVHNPTGNIKEARVGPAGFSPWLHAGVSGSTISFGDSESDSLHLVSLPGSKRSTVQLPIARRRPSTAMINAARDRELAMTRDDRGRGFIADRYSAERMARDLPFFGALVPGRDGEIWVQEYSGAPTTAVRYLVVSAMGVPRAWVSVPAGVRIRDVGVDYVVGTHEDDDGVETVRVYRLTRR